MQHYALIPFCSALPFEKGRTPMLSAIPGITDSTTLTNYTNHCNSIKCYIVDLVTQVSNLTKITVENKVAMSLHIHHMPQVDMLEYRLEILLIAPHPKNLHI
jgi:hypothetical protein